MSKNFFHNKNWDSVPSQENRQEPAHMWNNNYQQGGFVAPPPPSISQHGQVTANPSFRGNYQPTYSDIPNAGYTGNLHPAYAATPNPSFNYQSAYSGGLPVPNQSPGNNAPNHMGEGIPTGNLPQSVHSSVQAKKGTIQDEVQRQKAALSVQRTEYIRKVKRLKDELDLLKEQRSDLQGDSRRSPSPDTKSYLQNNAKLQMEIQKELTTLCNTVKMLNSIIENQGSSISNSNDSEDRSSRRKGGRSEKRRSRNNSRDRDHVSNSQEKSRTERDRSAKQDKNLLVELQKKLRESQRRESRLREERDRHRDGLRDKTSQSLTNDKELSKEVQDILLSGIFTTREEDTGCEDEPMDKWGGTGSNDNEYRS